MTTIALSRVRVSTLKARPTSLRSDEKPSAARLLDDARAYDRRAIAETKALRSPTAGPLGRLEIRNRYTGRLLRSLYTNTLAGANLAGADLVEADLAGSNLRCADLQDASLMAAELRGANLSGANLAGADLSRADLGGAQLRGATFDAQTRWPAGFDAEARGAVRTIASRRPWWRIWD